MVIKVIYPGSFDPPTVGHVNILRQALEIFDHVVVAIGINPEKAPLFSVEERARFWVGYLQPWPGAGVSIETYEGLTVDFAREIGAKAIIRGLRDAHDLRSEHYVARINKRIDGMTTLFLLPEDNHILISSTFVRQVAEMGSFLDTKLDGLVSPMVIDALRAKFHDC